MTTVSDKGWYLEGCLEGEQVSRRFDLRGFPVRIGRAAESDVPLPVANVSGRHAEIYLADGRVWLRDLGSSNGTYVNRIPVTEPVVLAPGDVLHLADTELLVNCAQEQPEIGMETCVMTASPAIMATGAHSRARSLRALLEQQQVSAVFQPIISLHSAQPVAFEVLGRGTRDDLPEAPGALFQIAEQAQLAGELSSVMRRSGLAAAATLPGAPHIYTNAHPAELANDRLFTELARARRQHPARALTVEVHESTVTDPAAMRRLRARLSELEIGIAYDDFGAGQARLLELAECPPDYLKFDISLIRDIDTATDSRQRMVETLVRIASELGVRCLAEGIERSGELEACRALGFELAQGYFIARPAPAGQWREPWSSRRAARDDRNEEERTVVAVR